jgi:segregation and condensation protein B
MLESTLKALLEAVLLAANKPLTEEQLLAVFAEEEKPAIGELRSALLSLQADCEYRGIELAQVASGYRFQVKQSYISWVGKLWEEKAQKYSRAVLETLALIAYRQPITRGEIEEIRGVAVSTHILKTLLEDREWIRMVGHKEVPGRPALYATTKAFLDYFGLKHLKELPSLPELLNPEDPVNIHIDTTIPETTEIDEKIDETADIAT